MTVSTVSTEIEGCPHAGRLPQAAAMILVPVLKRYESS
jgi:hypothetical protein